MNVFLTGGTGFIGQPLTKALLGRGWNVTALVRNPDSPRAQALTKMGAQLAPGDITERESMRAAMNGADIVVHCAGQYEFGMNKSGKQRICSINVKGTENVLGLAYDLNIPRTIHVSTVQAYGDTGPQQRDETFTRQIPCCTSYEQSKTDAHGIACQYQQKGMPLIIVCPHQVVGANDHSAFGYFLRLYVNRVLPPIAWSPDSIFCCIELSDLAEGIALATEKGRIGESYLLVGDPLSFREIFECWGKKPGAFTPRLWLPVYLATILFAPLEPLQRMLGLPAFMSRETVLAGATTWNYSSEKAKRELGWTYRSAEDVWFTAIEEEIKLLSRRRTQNVIQRLKPLDVVD